MALVKNPLLPGPFAVLPGSGGEQFRQLNVMGWQASWKADDPVYAPASTLAAFATPNPALVLDLAPGAPTDALKTEAEKFGKARLRGGVAATGARDAPPSVGVPSPRDTPLAHTAACPAPCRWRR